MLEVELYGCAERLWASQELVSKYIKSSNDVQCDLDDFALKGQGMEQMVLEEANKAVIQAIMKTRFEMMLEYHKG